MDAISIVFLILWKILKFLGKNLKNFLRSKLRLHVWYSFKVSCQPFYLLRICANRVISFFKSSKFLKMKLFLSHNDLLENELWKFSLSILIKRLQPIIMLKISWKYIKQISFNFVPKKKSHLHTNAFPYTYLVEFR